LSVTSSGVPRGSVLVTRTRTGVASPTRALAEASMPGTARSSPPPPPTTSACTGSPSARAAATGSSPAFTVPSLTTTTPAACSAAGDAASAASASPSAVVPGPGAAAESGARPEAKLITSTLARPRHARLISATARSATTARVAPPGATGSCMLRERSSSTTRCGRPPRARSSTGWASSHSRSTSAATRSRVRARRASAGTGGTTKR
jgi:hypothetical protein